MSACVILDFQFVQRSYGETACTIVDARRPKALACSMKPKPQRMVLGLPALSAAQINFGVTVSFVPPDFTNNQSARKRVTSGLQGSGRGEDDPRFVMLARRNPHSKPLRISLRCRFHSDFLWVFAGYFWLLWDLFRGSTQNLLDFHRQRTADYAQ